MPGEATLARLRVSRGLLGAAVPIASLLRLAASFHVAVTLTFGTTDIRIGLSDFVPLLVLPAPGNSDFGATAFSRFRSHPMSNKAALVLVLAMAALSWFAPAPVAPRCDPLMSLPWVKC